MMRPIHTNALQTAESVFFTQNRNAKRVLSEPFSKSVHVRKKRSDVPKRHNTRSVLGIEISHLSERTFYGIIEQVLKPVQIKQERQLFIATVNPEFIMEAKEDPQFKQILNQTSLNTADGTGVCLAMQGLHRVTQPRITGSDSTTEICKLAAKYRRNIFLLGAAEGIAAKAAQRLKETIPGLEVCGVYSPKNRVDPLETYPEAIQEHIMEANLLFVALGAPAQEKWIARNLSSLPNCRIAMGIGGTLDFIAGEVNRAPKWMQIIGLEWLYRLLVNPSRWRRMLKLPIFVGHFVKEWLNSFWNYKFDPRNIHVKEHPLLWQLPLLENPIKRF